MKKTKIIEKKEFSFKCTNCNNHEFTITHLMNKKWKGNFGPWHCDNCGVSFNGEFRNKKLYIERANSTIKKDTLVCLKKDNIYLIVKGICLDDSIEHDEYHYEEKTCPTNYLSRVMVIIDAEDGDTDPHGIFEYVETIPYDEKIDEMSFEEIKKLFKKIN